MLLFPDDGGPRHVLGGHKPSSNPPWLGFTPDSKALLTLPRGVNAESRVRMLEVPSGRELRWLAPNLSDSEFLPSVPSLAVRDEGMLFVVRTRRPDGDTMRLEIAPYDGTAPRAVGSVRGQVWTSRDGQNIAVVRGDRLFVRPVFGPSTTELRRVASVATASLNDVVFSPRGDRLAVGELSGKLTVWPLDGESRSPIRVLTLTQMDPYSTPSFGPQEDRITWCSSSEKSVYVWDLDGPPDAEPTVLRRPDASFTKDALFHPSGEWVAVINHESLTFWFVGRPHVRVLRGTQAITQILFTADSSWLISCVDSDFDPQGRGASVRIWPLRPELGSSRTLPAGLCRGVAVDPHAEKVVVGGPSGAAVFPFSGGEPDWILHFDKQEMQERGHSISGLAFDASGHRLAASSRFSPARPPQQTIYEWDLETGTSREMSLIPDGDVAEGAFDWNAGSVALTADGHILTAGTRGVRRFDLEAGKSQWIWKLTKGEEAVMSLSADGRRLLAAARSEPVAEAPERFAVLFDLQEGTEHTFPSHGNRIWSVALDRSGRTIVTGDRDGVVRVGRVDGGEPHLLLGHSESVEDVAVSPDGRFIASAAGREIRLWPMPDLDEPPIHTLARDEILSRLRELTNLELVEDEDAPTGFRLVTGPFPGWAEALKW